MVEDISNINYQEQNDNIKCNTFDEEYFTGADIAIYINNERITNISSIKFSLKEQLKPIYGYASRTFDDIAVGNRIISGSFKVFLSNIEKESCYNREMCKKSVSEEESNNEKPHWAKNVGYK